MTRKDYIKLAQALHFVKPSMPVCPPKDHKIALQYMSKQWSDTVMELIPVLKSDNPRFDGAKFLHACLDGIPSKADKEETDNA